MQDVIKDYLLERIGTPAPGTHQSKLDVIDAASLMEKHFDALRAPVEGLIVEGLTLLCGSSKVGKSWLVLSMCLAVAAGRPFLGRNTQQGNVLYLALEDSKRRLQERITKLGGTPSVDLGFATKSRNLEEGLIDDLAEWAERVNRPQMIVIDTLQKVRAPAPARTNAYALDYSVMARLKAFADEHHVAVVLVHHLNKMKDAADPFDRISGSTGLMGAADTTILIVRERGSEDAKVTYVGRDVWGDDFMIRMQDGHWALIGKEAIERERYETNPIVTTCRELLKNSFGGTVKISLRGFLDAAAEINSACIASTVNELSKKLNAIAPEMQKYDGTMLSMGKRVGNERGLWIAGRV